MEASLLEPEPPLLAMRHIQELLRIILLNMNYDEIIAFCNTHPEFKGLCDDPESIVGQTLREKERSAIAKVHNIWQNFEEDYFLLKVELMCSDIVSNEFKFGITRSEIDELERENSVYLEDSRYWIEITAENMVRIMTQPERHPLIIMMHHDLFRKILEVEENMHRDNLEGVTEIYRNGDTRYIG